MTQEVTHPEIQDEINNIQNDDENLNPSSNSPPQNNIESETAQVDENGNALPFPQVDHSDPAFKAGAEHMKKSVQDAFNKRINKVISGRRALEGTVSQLKNEIAEIRKASAKTEQPPKIQDYLNSGKSEEEWVKDSYAYHAKQNGAQPKAKQAQQNTTDISVVVQQFSVKEEQYAKTHPNYHNNMDNIVPYLRDNKDLQTAIFESGPDVVDYLGQNVDIMDQISTLPPIKMGKALEKIEVSVKRDRPAQTKVPKTKPEPTDQNGGKTNTSTGKDISKMSQAEYNKYMRESGY